ncbi:MAG: hypothetical protein ACPG37_00995 [Luminiphilus sp.]
MNEPSHCEKNATFFVTLSGALNWDGRQHGSDANRLAAMDMDDADPTNFLAGNPGTRKFSVSSASAYASSAALYGSGTLMFSMQYEYVSRFYRLALWLASVRAFDGDQVLGSVVLHAD